MHYLLHQRPLRRTPLAELCEQRRRATDHVLLLRVGGGQPALRRFGAGKAAANREQRVEEFLSIGACILGHDLLACKAVP